MKGRYFINIIIRVILISLNSFAAVWLYMNTDRPATTFFAFLLLAIQTTGLIYYHKRIMRDLHNSLAFLEENDTTFAFSLKRVEKNFEGLVSRLNKINLNLQSARIERERQYHYLQALVKQIDTGIVSFDQDGKIEIFNPAAAGLLGIRDIKNINDLVSEFPQLVKIAVPGRKAFSSAVKITVNGSEKMLAVKMGALRLDEKWVRFVSLQNIKQELEAGELDAWRKLLRIQRHEIINSLTPISTLTTAIKRRFISGNRTKLPEELSGELIADVLNSVDVIEERSSGLAEFMERFKGITDLPGLKSGKVSLKNLFNTTITLFSNEINEKGIDVKSQVIPENLTAQGDEKLLEQVLINLVKNSVEAIMNNTGKIELKAFRTSGSIVIRVTDNGEGIDSSLFESIFVPSFYHKRKRFRIRFKHIAANCSAS